MEKTFLEKRIEEKAKARFEKEYREFARLAFKNPIFNKIILKTAKGGVQLFKESTGGIDVLFSEYSYSDGIKTVSDNTNFYELKKVLIDQFIKEETDSFMARINSFEDYFNQNQ